MGANAVGMSTSPLATTEIESEARDRSSKKHIIFFKKWYIFDEGGGALGRKFTKGGGP